MQIWKAEDYVLDLANKVKEKHHLPHLQMASVAVCFSSAKAFVKERFNWGRVMKFGPAAKLYQGDQYDFLITLPQQGWDDVLTAEQREAWLDLNLSRCQAELEPETHEVNGKAKPVKDNFGRIKYTIDMKLDAEGNPKWKVAPLDLHVYTDNVLRYGPWCEDLLDFQSALGNKDKRDAFRKAMHIETTFEEVTA